MDVASLNGLTGAGQSAGAGKALASNFDTFLKLLTAQLQNQDPLEPMDASEFTRQLVQYSSVEQGIYTNRNLERLISLQQTSNLGTAVSYLGKDVEAEGDRARLAGGRASWSYELGRPAASVQIQVADERGRVVYAGTGPGLAGRNEFVWDGRTASGGTAPDGAYRIVVTARDDQGAALTARTSIVGRVTAAESASGEIMLTVGGLALPLTDVRSVREPTGA